MRSMGLMCHRSTTLMKRRFRCFLLTIISIFLILINQLFLLSITTNVNAKGTMEIPTMMILPQNRLGLQQPFSHQEEDESSKAATVMGIAVGYKLDVYERFVGTLRKSGFEGHIILGLDEATLSDDVRRYLRYRNVTMKFLNWIQCTYRSKDSDMVDIHNKKCADPYPDVNIGWSRHSLFRDWLLECKTCTGPVLNADTRDTFFQLNPFGPGSPTIDGLQVFEELKYNGKRDGHSTLSWLTHPPIHKCKNITITETMICAGTTAGTREAMLQYLNDFEEETEIWNNGTTQDCHDAIHMYGGGDQALHNYLYYMGKLTNATAIPNREGIVNTVGSISEFVVSKKLSQQERKGWRRKGKFPGANGTQWIGKQFNVVDEEGYFTQFDGSRSRVVHQFDRFVIPIQRWMKENDWFYDPIPDGFV